MMLIPCPHCGPRVQEEFAYERTLDSVVRLDDGPVTAMSRLYTRANPRGEEIEIWSHVHGCGQWLRLRRDRVTHAISDVEAI
ncbi:sarcosine oxidase delta subunit [Novosphingobium nitrogenifigens DSM 19370]|uniref:Sarcosine oxidase delta subunit n=1 Tax=Novosphingobium nitrogenifigens DSM 19370 TaxID=983920 RepID=F1ZAF4_9SPHN|nr:sarcosine oxidase subunit delta [Novosphingobium nitrogenifigens]EGD58438.1 sarcosine oxidase delta subunit [Novosphingobium nitrogenifigens DSM 19370]